MRITIKKSGKKISLNVREMKGINKMLGLMCYRDNLLFNFNSIKQPIHSFFCPSFLACWLDKNNQVLEMRKIKPWQINLKPKQEFSKLIEIPLSNYKIVKFLVGN